MRLLLLFLLLGPACYAQEYNKVKIGFAVGYPLTWPVSNSSTNNPIQLNFEPSYRLNDKIVVGIRMEAAFRNEGSIRSNGIFGQYYFSNKQFRPFVGLGVGFFTPSSNYKINGQPYYTNGEESRVGFFPRIGVDFGHLTLAMDYNIAGASKTVLNNQSDGTTAVSEIKNEYASIKIGIFVGGGRKK